jgi:methionyl-tRNA formyltransferase
MDKGLDTGDMLLWRETPITPEDNVETLHDRLAIIGGELICETLDGLEKGTVTRTPQTGETCYAPLITAETKKLSFNLTKREIINKIRGLSPVPGAVATAGGKTVKVFAAEETDGPHDGKLTVKVADGWIRVTQLAPEGKKKMSDEDLLRGNRNFAFDV